MESKGRPLTQQERERETDRQTDTKRQRETDRRRETDRQTHIQTERGESKRERER